MVVHRIHDHFIDKHTQPTKIHAGLIKLQCEAQRGKHSTDGRNPRHGWTPRCLKHKGQFGFTVCDECVRRVKVPLTTPMFAVPIVPVCLFLWWPRHEIVEGKGDCAIMGTHSVAEIGNGNWVTRDGQRIVAPVGHFFLSRIHSPFLGGAGRTGYVFRPKQRSRPSALNPHNS